MDLTGELPTLEAIAIESPKLKRKWRGPKSKRNRESIAHGTVIKDK